MSRFSMILRLYVLCIITVLLFGMTGTVIVHIVATFATISGSLYLALLFGFFAVLLLLGIHFGLIAAIVASIVQLRLARASLQQDYKALPESEQQPVMIDALHDGDTLLLQRTGTLSQSLRQLGTATLGAFMLFALIEGFLIFVSTPLNIWFAIRLGLSFGDSPTPVLAPLDWLVLLYPVIIFGVLLASTILSTFKENYWQLRADDVGISLQSGRQRRFIGWNMLQAIVQNKVKFTQDLPATTYYLVGKDGSMFPFTIDNPSLTGEAPSRFTYVGGYEQYSADMTRLLATIRARSMLALRYNATAIRMRRRLQRCMPLASIDTDAILTSTIADTSWQPAVISAQTTIDKIVVASRLSRWKIFWQGVISEICWILAISFALYLSGSASQLGRSITEIQSQPIVIPQSIPTIVVILLILLVLLIVLAFVALIGIFSSIGFITAHTRQRRRMPALGVMPDGIANTTKQDSSQPNVIPWKDIQAWLVMPANATRDFDTYVIVYGANKKIYWRVNRDMELAGRRVTGDRKIAFQEKLGEAHSIIAARTGLALRLIESNDAPV